MFLNDNFQSISRDDVSPTLVPLVKWRTIILSVVIIVHSLWLRFGSDRTYEVFETTASLTEKIAIILFFCVLQVLVIEHFVGSLSSVRVFH